MPIRGSNICRDRRNLFQYYSKSLFVETDDQLFTDAQHWRAERSRPAENQARDFVFVVDFLQIEVDEFPASSHIKFLHPVQQLERVAAFVTDFACVDLLDRVDTVLRKKLLRFLAGCSARSVVAPVNLRHRLSPLNVC